MSLRTWFRDWLNAPPEKLREECVRLQAGADKIRAVVLRELASSAINTRAAESLSAQSTLQSLRSSQSGDPRDSSSALALASSGGAP